MRSHNKRVASYQCAGQASVGASPYPLGNDPHNASDSPIYFLNKETDPPNTGYIWTWDDWKTWHTAMKIFWGKAKADETWKNALPAQRYAKPWIPFTNDLIAWAKTEGLYLELDNLLWPVNHNPNNPDHTPAMDSLTHIEEYIPGAYFWTTQDWMNWHNSVKNKYGKSVADEKLLIEWKDVAPNADIRADLSDDKVFHDWAKKEGLLDPMYEDSVMGKIQKKAEDLGKKAANAVEDTLGFTFTVLKYGLPAYLIYRIYEYNSNRKRRRA